MRSRALSFGILATTVPLCLWGQKLPAPRLESFSETVASVSIQVHTSGGGDVDFLSLNLGPRSSVDFAELARKSLGCDWQGLPTHSLSSTGSCRHLLGDGVSAHWLHLAPLVIALRGSGIQEVYLTFFQSRRAETSVSAATGWRQEEGWGDNRWSFESDSFAALPPALLLHPVPVTASSFLVPLLLLVSIPSAIAFLLRLGSRGRPTHALIWLTWLQLTAWLVWPTVLPPGRIVMLLARSPIRSFYAQLVVGVLVYVVPPLLASALALLAIRDRSVRGSGSTVDFLRRHFLPEVALAMAYGFPLMALALDLLDYVKVISGIVMGIGAAITFFYLLTRRGDGPKILETGEFRDRVIGMANMAGVTIKHLSILWDRTASEANAMVWRPGSHIFITDSLLRSLNKREVDAVIAHEVGHLRGRPPWFIPPKLYAAFFFVYAIGHILLNNSPVSTESYLPGIAFVLLLIGARSFRRHEFHADISSAQITHDPRALISGLGRAAKVRSLPLEWGRLEGMALTHPSFRRRAISLARACQMPEKVALALLENPDLLEGESGCMPEFYDLVVEAAAKNQVFTKTARTGQLARAALALPVLIVFLVFAFASVTGLLPGIGVPLDPAIVFVFGLPGVLWLSLEISAAQSRRFCRKVALAIARQLPGGPEGELVGLLPGDELRGVDGFVVWDFGRLVLSGGAMTYSGERANFSLPRTAITAMEVTGKRLGWSRGYGVLVRWEGGTMIIRNAMVGNSRGPVARLQRRMSTWWKTDSEAPAPSGFPLPDLPALPPDPPPDGKALKYVVLMSCLMLLIGTAVAASRPATVSNILAVPAGPGLLLLAYLPGLLGLHRKRQATAPQSFPARAEEELLAKAQANSK